MVEIKYKGNYEVADLAGKSLADVRNDFQSKFDIPVKARARVNDRKVKLSEEPTLRLRDSDEVRFAVEHSGKGALLVGAMLLSLAITGGVFAFGALTTTTTFNSITSAAKDFASVTENTTNRLTTNIFGLYKGKVNAGPLFNIYPAEGYPGDLVATISFANADKLVRVYRVLNLFLSVVNSQGDPASIDGTTTNNATNKILLTLDNGAVSVFLPGSGGTDNYTVAIDSGYYVSNIYNFTNWVTNGSASPQFYVDIGQR